MRSRPTLLFLALSAALVAGDAPAIGPVDAANLFSREFPRATVVSAEIESREGRPYWMLEAREGDRAYRAEVDAGSARLMSVRSGGEQVYRAPRARLVAHRGNVHDAPENTLAAFEKAIELGADLIEIDVRQTRDGHMVILHDATVDRTTDGSGPIAEMTLAEARSLDAGSWFRPGFAGQRIPTLKEALLAMKGRATPDLDFKAGDPAKLVAVLGQTGMLGQTTLASGDWGLIRSTLEVSPRFKIRPAAPHGLLGLFETVQAFDPPLVNINWNDFSHELIRRVHLSGRKAWVNILGVNDNEFGMRQALDAGVDFIQSDRLDLLVPMMREADGGRP